LYILFNVHLTDIISHYNINDYMKNTLNTWN